MRINKVVGNVRIDVNTDRFDKNVIQAHKLLNLQVVHDCNLFIPKLNGALRSSVRYPNGLYGDEIAWNTPYAHYQYEGELYLTEDGRSFANKDERKYPAGKPLEYHEPGTTSHWFDKAKEEHLNDWIKLVKETVGEG